jgi:hypothetical protein
MLPDARYWRTPNLSIFEKYIAYSRSVTTEANLPMAGA